VESNEVRGERDEGRTRTLICFAVKEEAAPFLKFAGNDRDISVLVTGMGKMNSDRMVRERLAQAAPSRVLTCGFAGALNPGFKIGDVLFEKDAGSGLGELLRASGASPAKFYCSSRVATTAAEKTALRQSTGADVVEMESGVIREICREKKIPSATIRVISDAANQDLPLDFNALMTPEQTISFSKLALALVKSPGKIPQLMELQRNTRFAAQRLAEVLEKLLSRGNRGGGTAGLR
jgi:nucleoside phosphorylase